VSPTGDSTPIPARGSASPGRRRGRTLRGVAAAQGSAAAAPLCTSEIQLTTQDAEGSPPSITLPRMAIRTPREEVYFFIREADWTRMTSRIQDLANPLPYLGQLGWASVGIASGSLLALIPWLGAYSQLPQLAQLHYAWISPLLLSISGAFTLIAASSFIAHLLVRRRNVVTVKALVAEMNEIHRSYASPNESLPTVQPTNMGQTMTHAERGERKHKL
jgi:hypothetical protein